MAEARTAQCRSLPFCEPVPRLAWQQVALCTFTFPAILHRLGPCMLPVPLSLAAVAEAYSTMTKDWTSIREEACYYYFEKGESLTKVRKRLRGRGFEAG